MTAPLIHVSGTAYPFGMKNCDTDVIIAAQWLKTISRAGLGKGAFAGLRETPDNVFDDPRYAGSPILIAGDNFGCGSSREHAAWAIADMGVRVVIAPSFSDIFSGNAFKNGILTVALPRDVVDRLLEVAKSDSIEIDLEHQKVTTGFQDRYEFEIDPFRKHCLLGGLDEISLTMTADDAITEHERQAEAQALWLRLARA